MAARTGTASHKAIEYFSSFEFAPSKKELREFIKAQVLHLSTKENLGPILAGLGTKLEEAKLLAPERLNEQVEYVRNRILNLPNDRSRGMQKPKVVQGIRNPGPGNYNKAEEEFGIERPLKSDRLGISGKADLVEELAQNIIRITDFKTGRVFDEDGKVNNDYVVQLGAYGLLVKERHPESDVRLRLIGRRGEQWERPLSEIETVADQAVDFLVKSAPFGVPLVASEIATPGSACHYCSYRISCSSYRIWAPEQWASSGKTSEMPLDTWGSIRSIVRVGHNLMSIELNDAAGRLVRINNLPIGLFTRPPNEGDGVEFFDLKSTEGMRGGLYPYNFIICDMSRARKPWYSALCATVNFVEDGVWKRESL
jgi:hypothetical protein